MLKVARTDGKPTTDGVKIKKVVFGGKGVYTPPQEANTDKGTGEEQNHGRRSED